MKRIPIRGTVYVEVTDGISLARNGWMIKWAREAGLTRLVDRETPVDPAAAHRQLQELIEDAFAADAVVPLLAGVLVPEGKEWTPAVAAGTMADIGMAKDDEAVVLLSAFAELVVSFLKRAPAFWRTIGRSLSLPGDAEPLGARDSERAPDSPTPAPAASTTSPGTSPVTTGPASTS